MRTFFCLTKRFLLNRELLDEVRRLEEKELSCQTVERPTFEIQPQKKLAPLNEGGPMQLLHLQVHLCN